MSLVESQENTLVLQVPQALDATAKLEGAGGCWDLTLPIHKAQSFQGCQFFRKHADCQPNVMSEQRSQEINFSMKQKSN